MDSEVPESCKASFHTPSLGLMAMFGDEDDADDNIQDDFFNSLPKISKC